MSDVTASKIVMHVDETLQICVDFGPLLRSGETLSDPSVVSTTPSSGLTTASVAVNSAEFTDVDGVKTVAANEGVQMTLTASRKREYDIVVRATNSNGVATPAVTQPVEVLG